MDRMRNTDEDEDLRRYGVKEDTLRHIDVTEAVMNRVYNANPVNNKLGVTFAKFNTRRRATIVTSAFAILLLTAVTVQATTGYLEIRNKAGAPVIRVKEYVRSLSSPSKKIDQLLEQYYEQAKATLQPGDLVAYYINDKAAYNPYDTINPMKYVYESHDTPTYEDYVQTAEQKLAPKLTPTFMPEGYKYKSGDIVPPFPSSGVPTSPYQSLLENFLLKAATTHANEKLIVESVPWTQAGGVLLTFTNGNTNILLTAFKGESATIYADDQFLREIVTIFGQEVMYIDAHLATSSTTYYTNKIGWYDEQAGVVYSIEDFGDSSLSKEDFIKIAEGIIAK